MLGERKYRASMDLGATQEETAAVQELLDELDLGIQVRSDHTDRGAIEALPWTLTIAIPVMTFLTAFTKKMGNALPMLPRTGWMRLRRHCAAG